MESIIIALVSDPLYYIGMVLAAAGAGAFLLFMRGFASGVGNLFHMHGHEGHLEHARVRIVWGLYLCMLLLGVWQILRVIAGTAPLSQLWLALILLSPAWIPWLYKKATGKGGGNGH